MVEELQYLKEHQHSSGVNLNKWTNPCYIAVFYHFYISTMFSSNVRGKCWGETLLLFNIWHVLNHSLEYFQSFKDQKARRKASVS